jgi:glucose-6-phosphate 1-dehydrogenase
LFLRRSPQLAFLPHRRRAEPNQIVLRIDPEPGFRMRLSALHGQTWRDIHLDSSFAADLGPAMRPYERLLHAGLIGDRQRFAREDSIEETWRILEPVLERPGALHLYEPGSWFPDAASALLRGHHRWHNPRCRT